MSNFKQALNFNIPVAPDDISNFLAKVSEEVCRYTLLSDKAKSRMKLILIELCTNFIKHVKTNEGEINIEIDRKYVIINKRYKENSFKKVIDSKIDIGKLGEIVEIYFSETNNHYIKVLENNKLRFLDPFEMGLYSDKLKDHFGLHILTLASDDFLYEYNCKTGEDCFTLYLKCV